jgi:hypothetical protein
VVSANDSRDVEDTNGASDDTEPLPLLPQSPAGEDDTPLAEGFELTLALSEDGEEDLDDSVASELEHGIDVAGVEEDAEDLDDGTVDLGAAAFDPGIEDESEDGDEAGPLGAEGDTDIGQEEAFDADETEGTTDRLDEFLTTDLPSLELEADMETGPEGEPIVLSSAEDAEADEEEALRRAELPWAEMPLPASLPACAVLAVERGGGRVIGGGDEIFSVDDAGLKVVLAPGLQEPAQSLVEGAEPGSLLFTTESGELLRHLPGQAARDRLVAFRETTAAQRPSHVPEIQLGGPTRSQRPAILLLVRDGRGTLLESTDFGTTWRRVELGGSVTCLSRGCPPVCLVDTGRAARFFVSEASGGFSPIGAPYAGESDGLVMATHDDVVVLLAAGSGISVSANRGATFKPVAGSTRATAVVAGRLGPRPSCFAALFGTKNGRATLVWIDAATGDAFAIATIEPGEDDADDLCRVDSLAWDPHTETLWASGAFGLRRFRRPPSA